MVLDQSLPVTITATILGLAAQIEREFISARTKEALARRKAAGLPVGRPKGRATKLMLDDRRSVERVLNQTRQRQRGPERDYGPSR